MHNSQSIAEQVAELFDEFGPAQLGGRADGFRFFKRSTRPPGRPRRSALKIVKKPQPRQHFYQGIPKDWKSLVAAAGIAPARFREILKTRYRRAP